MTIPLHNRVFSEVGFSSLTSRASLPIASAVRMMLIGYLLAVGYSQAQTAAPAVTTIQVDLNQDRGPLKPIWAWFGYDEPNYTYMKDGQKLLTEISQLSRVPVYVRAHSLLVTGDGKPGLKWGSTNAYTEDTNGKPVYNWTIVDRIFDTYIKRGMKPIAQIGFMPEALSTHPQPYKHNWSPGDKYSTVFTGWAYPPKDYTKWAELVYQWVRHSVSRYGQKEVESWYWELWNEPNIPYWKGTVEEYIKLYDYTADAVKRALPTAKIGGPEVTGPGSEDSQKFFKAFMDHIVSGKNAVTGQTGAPLDFITFHAKGAPKLVKDASGESHVQMNMGTQLRDIDKGFAIVSSYPTLKHLPIIIGESDPEGCAACSEDFHPQNAYRNGTMYSSYTAASFARKYDLAQAREVNLLGAVTWAFEFEDQPWFRGFRDLATNGVDKPVLNVFRMFGMMPGQRVAVQGGGAYDYARVRDESVRAEADVNALASRDAKSMAVLVWNYHDDNVVAPAAPVSIQVKGMPAKQATLRHYRIDNQHSNSYEVWKKMGSPQKPTTSQIADLEKAGQLQQLTAPATVSITNQTATLAFELPRQGVSLLLLTWP